jgi:hypothetical protein
MLTIVVSRVAPTSPPVMRLPMSMRESEMRPEIAARTSHHSRSSFARSTCARAPASVFRPSAEQRHGG